ncbi:Serine--tRNA ligase [Buchnera aphidicola (Tetraneura ulmi)]|uniref:serine--tRNA ligase n=1 Tax=Buchnera aphidicola TaxID=9 RepID=UPI00346424A3
MLDNKLLKFKLEEVKKKLLRRNFFLDSEKIISLEKERKKIQLKTENLQAKRNLLSKLIGNSKVLKQDTTLLYSKSITLQKKLNNFKKKLAEIKQKIKKIFLEFPNIPDDSIPNGENENNNKKILNWGEIPKFKFLVKDHIKLGKERNGFDWNAAALISGSRFSIMKGNIAKLHRALGQFMIDLHTEKHGYLETYVPYLVNRHCLYGTGQLPKFSKDLFHIEKKTDQKHSKYILIPTAEVPLTNIVQNKILEEHELPIKLVAKTPCFRLESASYGKDVKGLIRLHQFEKVELVQIVKPETSMHMLEQLTLNAEKVLKLLELPYQKKILCCGDLSFSASKTYDLEVWFPAQNTYREVSSCSNMLDFQSRRMRSRYRNSNKKIFFLHTLNGSGLAIGRTLAAILENNQLENGKILIPTVLQKRYMNGIKYI